MRRYVLDTQLYVHAFRNEDAARDLEKYYAVFTPVTFVSSVVVHELLAGASTPAKARQIREGLLGPLIRARRVVTPSHASWERAADGLAKMARAEPRELRTVPKSLVNDFMIAASCREAGMTIITENVADFSLVQKYVPHDHTRPWPKG